MSRKHTPGPWVVGPIDDTVVTHLGKDGVRYEVAAIDGDYNDPTNWPIMEANARLIAAAPDMLEALEKAKETIRAWHGPVAWEIYDRASPEMKMINAAIAKAGGAS